MVQTLKDKRYKTVVSELALVVDARQKMVQVLRTFFFATIKVQHSAVDSNANRIYYDQGVEGPCHNTWQIQLATKQGPVWKVLEQNTAQHGLFYCLA